MNLKTEPPKIFYGWYVLAIGMFGAFMGAGTSQVFMSTMLKPLTEEFGWSRTIDDGCDHRPVPFWRDSFRFSLAGWPIDMDLDY